MKRRHQDIPDKKSSRDNTAGRLKIDGQVEVDELLANILEQESLLIYNRLALERARID